ncbi:hypothetical protein HBH56_040980 [Parastagonospora nodorum]|uniref:Chitin-binding type-1 domain-containing protein n=2 Tax=Phaeosphaeria nodorum (strain SN15 / ATCC MYA-4574 / FGSC 10173) TaxID=321614 RepID=A0A7U2ETZ4_PHANO|nr:hypothetical protein SNOG_07913 [Parastagonospora nodorum SN15]KAH3917483.1 hypothetical protein HBH56_040980 [Parastagonospora nodorum]EAT84189.1 hypothetical protein SNOG_07913 [Parastagonospora nodorum SN15]KAH3933045.1 hypothetical protein HBH54_068730 [Parastagonospora nodorum]KAH3943548.1 hypothetical protein HBH53_172900 [Parastagonospora nodorum]KAH3961769.1 hypothetical protein HBH52_228090 [Parastagonospora nodorum]
MVLTATALAALAAFLQVAVADRQVHFVNKCPYALFYWVVGPEKSNLPSGDENHYEVFANSNSSHAMLDTRGWGGGVSLKIRDVPYYEHQPAGILQVEYTLDPAKRSIWYDMSYIDCDANVGYKDPKYCPLKDGGITLETPAKFNCPNASCEHGVCSKVYDKHGAWPGEPSYACDLDSDIMVTTCTHGAGQPTYDWKNEPDNSTPTVPAPVVPAPVAPSPIASESAVLAAPKPIYISPNGTCGGSTGYKCEGSPFGDCCSRFGWCGSSPEHCDTVPRNSTCTIPERLTVPARLPNVSNNGLCGAKNGLSCEGSQFGNCCSRWNYCGDTAEYCEDGCQDAFGLCNNEYKLDLAMNVTIAKGVVTKKN